MELAELELQGQPLPKQQRLSLQQREMNSIMVILMLCQCSIVYCLIC